MSDDILAKVQASIQKANAKKTEDAAGEPAPKTTEPDAPVPSIEEPGQTPDTGSGEGSGDSGGDGADQENTPEVKPDPDPETKPEPKAKAAPKAKAQPKKEDGDLSHLPKRTRLEIEKGREILARKANAGRSVDKK